MMPVEEYIARTQAQARDETVAKEKSPVKANVGEPRARTEADIVSNRTARQERQRAHSERSKSALGRMRWITNVSISYNVL